MTSEKQIEANRRNAQKSTGPKTPEGKAVVSLNALQHGLRARRAVLPGEDQEEFRQLCAGLETDWQPQNLTEQILLEEMAVAHWKLARLEGAEGKLIVQGSANKDQMALLAQFSQQQARLKRSFLTSMRALEHLQKTRPTQENHPAQAPARETVAEFPPPMAATAAAAPCELAAAPAAPDAYGKCNRFSVVTDTAADCADVFPAAS